MLPRYGAPPKNGQRYQLRPGVYAILPLNYGILATYQRDPDGEYQLPGGGVDPGEHPLAALRREVLEETGWILSGPRRLGAFRRFAYMPEYDMWAEKLCAVYLAKPIRKLADPSEPGHTAIVMQCDSALKLLGNHGDRMFLRRAQKFGFVR